MKFCLKCNSLRSDLHPGHHEPRNVSPRGRDEGTTETNIEQFGFVAAQRQPDAAGTYEQSIGVLNLMLNTPSRVFQ